MTYVGIDPGENGAAYFYDGEKYLCLKAGKANRVSVVNELRKRVNCLVAIEYQNYFTSGFRSSQSSSGKLGESFGFYCGACTALNLRAIQVVPRVWQSVFTKKNRKDFASSNLWKSHLKDVAQKEMGKQKATLWNADAFLILQYAILFEQERQRKLLN